MNSKLIALTTFTMAIPAFTAVAHATTISEILTTTVTSTNIYPSSPDFLSLFGPANASLTGDLVTISFSYDTSLLPPLSNFGHPGSYEGSSGSYVSGALSESVTINSHSYTQTLPTSVSVDGCTFSASPPTSCGGPPSTISSFQIALTGAGPSDEFGIDVVFDSPSPYTLGTLLNQQELDSYLATASFGFISSGQGPVCCETLYFGAISSSPAQAPEPNTYVLLALGFSGVAVLNRRRRR